MLTVTPAFQLNPAGRPLVHALSRSFEPFAQRCFKDSLAVLRAAVNAALFIVIVFIQLALNAYGRFSGKNNRQKAKDRKNTYQEGVDPSSKFPRKRLEGFSRVLFELERLEVDAIHDDDKEDPIDEGRSRNTDSSLELQLPAMSLASTPLTCKDLNEHLSSTTSARTRRVRRLISHLAQRTANDEPVHCHDKKIRKINSEYRKSQTPEEEVLLQDRSRSRTLRISNQPLVRQMTHAVSSVFGTPLRLPKNTVTVAYAPESVEGPTGGVGRFTYPPYPVSKAIDTSDRKWLW